MGIQAPRHPFPIPSLHKGICSATCCPAAAAAAALIPSNFLLHFTFLQRFDGFFGASCMADAAVPAVPAVPAAPCALAAAAVGAATDDSARLP